MWCKDCCCLLCATCGHRHEDHKGHYVKFFEEIREECEKELVHVNNTTSSFHLKANRNSKALKSAISEMEKVRFLCFFFNILTCNIGREKD